ncbi:methanogen output domain 1-containing protein [Pseudoroseicyclus aestuarii]|uniref:Metanogen output domain-containing protein n=1 Tax=Pseudoroseicyclus aestuarii TaxID=1795041 RepID=A0A318SW97_9RHOB|nr:methanogen output domain 1-containing protein [Pseudoroseicyclus aestuarii]PYE86150.1 hypothetical protein DFP88_101827 [Pseudoroseicyclus aestuarii]
MTDTEIDQGAVLDRARDAGLDAGPAAFDRITTPASLGRDAFFASVIGSLAASLEQTVGLEDASAFVTMVGNRLGEDLSIAYGHDIASAGTLAQGLAAALVDLKARIGGGFSVESIAENRITFVNSSCPFARQVEGRPSLCMMTTNVFGRIAADAAGYARVEINEAIALGHGRCRVTVDLDPLAAGNGFTFTR